MTANIKIPVASAEGVVAVPLAAVFTETSPDTGEMERYVYVAQGNDFERRPVQIGVSDFFFAEVQKGLSAGETVALELPKSVQTREAEAAKTTPGLRAGGGSTSAGRVRPATAR